LAMPQGDGVRLPAAEAREQALAALESKGYVRHSAQAALVECGWEVGRAEARLRGLGMSSSAAAARTAMTARSAAAGSSSPGRGVVVEVSSDSESDVEVVAEGPRGSKRPRVGERREGGAESEGVLRFVTWNVWFDPLEQRARMGALGRILEEVQPHVVALQEVTPEIYRLLQPRLGAEYEEGFGRGMAAMGRSYFCALFVRRDLKPEGWKAGPFGGSQMGRELQTCVAQFGGRKLVFATSHLESPLGWQVLNSEERVRQWGQSRAMLAAEVQRTGSAAAIMGGDFNWTEKNDGDLLDAGDVKRGWADVWGALRAGEPGYTYDGTKAGNEMLANSLRLRLDRVVLFAAPGLGVEPGAAMEDIQLLGRDPIPGLVYEKVVRGRAVAKPVLPSDHFGLHATFRLGTPRGKEDDA